MAMIADEPKLHIRDDEYGEVIEVRSLTLAELYAWLREMEASGARMMPNGGRGMTVIAPGMYVSVEV